MSLHHRFRLAALAALALVAAGAAGASAQTPAGFITSFEPAGPTEVTYPAGYTTGSLLFQDGWQGGAAFPRVQTADEIAAELTAAGLPSTNPVRSGNQALMVAKVDANVEGTGYFVRNVYSGLAEETKITVDFWARPLYSGAGADPTGTPSGNGKTIGERQGNIFFGVMDESEARAAAIRFGTDATGAPLYENVTNRHIDVASASTGNLNAPWVLSGQSWTPDEWYNIKLNLDFETKKYDFFLNGTKINSEPIRFYNEISQAATRFFVSRGTNQAGAILDDISITVTPEVPLTPGDFDENGFVDGDDFLLWQRDNTVGSLDDWKLNYGAGPGATPTVGAVPEPTSAALAIGMLLLATQRRKRTLSHREDAA